MAGLSPFSPPVSLSLSRYINNSPCLSTTQSWRFFPSDKVSRSFYKLIRVCSLWSRQLWTWRIDLAGEPAVPDHDFKQNPMFLWRGWPSPEQYLYYPLHMTGPIWGWREWREWDRQEVSARGHGGWDGWGGILIRAVLSWGAVEREISCGYWMWLRCWINHREPPGGQTDVTEAGCCPVLLGIRWYSTSAVMGGMHFGLL